MHRRLNKKLSPKNFGPYRVLEKVGSVAYKLALPQKAKIHNVFHVSVIKKWIDTGTPVQDILPTIIEDVELATPQAIQDQRINQGDEEFLVHWQGRSPADAT